MYFNELNVYNTIDSTWLCKYGLWAREARDKSVMVN